MALAAGTRLGPYEVLGLIGAGGMGEVYKARDPRLGREVAVKVLNVGAAVSADQLRRFEDEARAAAALNHPNILAVFDVGSHADSPYVVFELLEGETLRDRMGRGQLPLRTALDYAVQLCEGLAAAHMKGIVHRDLKPENVFLTRDGHTKIVDFGLAKLTSSTPDSEAATRLETERGLLVGTLAYMSPEQAEGRTLDARSDIFSLGSVLYEMTSGHRPFAGSSKVDLLHAIVHGGPRPLSEVKPDTPPELRLIIEKALENDPADRYQSTRDLVVDLKRVQRSLAASGAKSIASTRRTGPRRGPWIAAALAVLLASAAGVLRLLRPSDPGWTNPLASAQFRRVTDFEGSEFDAVLSANGNFVAFLSDRDGRVDLWVTQLGTAQFSNLTKGHFRLISLPTTIRVLNFSPEGSHVGVDIGDATSLVPIMGGSPRTLIDPGIEAVWSPDGRKLAFHDLTPGDPIFVADADASNRKLLFKGDPGQHNHYLSWSPDGEYLYFATGFVTSDEMDIWRMRLAGEAPERLTFHKGRTSYPVALDDRTLLYISTAPDAARTVLYALDLRLRVTRPINLGIRQYVSVAGSTDRRRLVVTESTPSGSLWTIPLSDGVSDESAVARFELPTARAVAPRFGRGYVLYLSSTGAPDGLWRFEQGAATELWQGDRGGVVTAPAISPDQSWIAFCVRQEGRTRLYRMGANGANPFLMSSSLEVRGAPSWSPDGQWIVVSGDDGTGPGVFKVPAAGGAAVRLLKGLYFHPLWSPDGQFVVYAEDDASGGTLRLGAITPDGEPFPVPALRVSYVWEAYRFMPRGNTLLVLQGGIGGVSQDFWLLDLSSGRRRQVTSLRATAVIQNFDISADGKSIIFDRTRENADVVLIDRPKE